MEKRVENWNQVHSYKLNTKFLKTNALLFLILNNNKRIV